MTAETQPAPRGGAAPFVWGGVLALAAVAVATVVAVLIGRAVVGYEITRFAADEPITIDLGDRGQALWRAPADTPVECVAVAEDTGEPSLSPGSADRMTITDGGSNWARIGIVEGEPGSRHLVRCSAFGSLESFGHAPNPRIARYVVIGVTGGVVALLLGAAAVTVFVVVAVRRSRVRRADAPA